MKKMQILLVCYEFPPLGGGAGNAMMNISKSFSMSGHTVTILTSRFKNQKAREYKDGYNVIRLPVLRKKMHTSNPFEMMTFIISSIVYVFLNFRKMKYDFGIAFLTIPSAVCLWLLYKYRKIPYIVSLRGGDVPGSLKRQLAIYHFFTKPLIKKIWNDSIGVVANSNYLGKLAQKTAPKLKTVIIPNGIDNEFFRPGFIKNKDSLIIISVGRFNEPKRFDLLLDVFCEITKRTSKKIELKIIGDGSLRSSLEKKISTLNIRMVVNLPGWLEKTELLKQYQESDIFVLLTREEGMPNVVLEALSCGLPVLISKVGGTQDIITDCVEGFYVSNEKDEIIEKLLIMIEDEKLRLKMSEQALKKAKSYSWQNVAEMYYNIAIKKLYL